MQLRKSVPHMVANASTVDFVKAAQALLQAAVGSTSSSDLEPKTWRKAMISPFTSARN